jgi:hypothetical protein
MSTLTSRKRIHPHRFRPEEHRTGKDRLYGDPSELVLRVGELHPVSGSQPVPTKQLPIGYGGRRTSYTLLPPPHGHWYSRHGLRTTTHREQQSGRHDGMQRDALLYQRHRGSALWEATIRKTQLSSTRLPPSAVCSRAPYNTLRETLQKNTITGRGEHLPSDEQVDSRSTTARSPPLAFGNSVLCQSRRRHGSTCQTEAKRNATRVTR